MWGKTREYNRWIERARERLWSKGGGKAAGIGGGGVGGDGDDGGSGGDSGGLVDHAAHCLGRCYADTKTLYVVGRGPVCLDGKMTGSLAGEGDSGTSQQNKTGISKTS